MWKINEDGTGAENKRAKTTMYACAAVLINDQYETRIAEMCDTLDEAKAALAKIVAVDNAEEAEELWQIDDDGNAFCPDGRIFRVPVTDNGGLPFKFIIVKKTKGVFDTTDFLDFAYDEAAARSIIQNLVDKYNDEDYDEEGDD